MMLMSPAGRAVEPIDIKTVNSKGQSEQTQLQQAKLCFSKGDKTAAQAWLQAAADNQSNIAKAILLNSELSWLNYIFFGSDFAPPFKGGRNLSGRAFFHCKRTGVESDIQVSHVVLDEKESTLDSIANFLKACSQKSQDEGKPEGLVLNPLPDKPSVPLTLLFSRSQFLYNEAMLLKPSHPEEAAKFMQDAVQLGLHDAEFEFAEMLLAGKGIEQDELLALKFFRKAAEHGESPKSWYRFGDLMQQKTTTDNDPKEGLAWLEKAAKAGHHDACLLVAQMYYDGRGTTPSLTKAREWLVSATSEGSTLSKPQLKNAILFLANICDRLGEPDPAIEALEYLANDGHSYAQLLLAFKYHCGIGVKANPSQGRKWMLAAAKEKVEPIDKDPAVLLAKVMIVLNYDTAYKAEQLKTLLRATTEFDDIYSIDIDSLDHRIIECKMQQPGGPKLVSLSCLNHDDEKEVHAEKLTEIVKKILSTEGTDSDPKPKPIGISLYLNLFERITGFREEHNIALIFPKQAEEKLVEAAQRSVIMRSGHHTHNWLAVMGDLDRIMPTLLKYMHRDWKKDISERNSGLEWLPQRLHFSLGKPTFGDVYVARIDVKCSVWIYVILSTPPPTLRPEIHTIFPVVVAKARKYYVTINQILEWHNRMESTHKLAIHFTTDKHSLAAVGVNAAITNAAEVMNSPLPKVEMPVFPIDFVSRRNIWEGKGCLEVFLSGIASWTIRNPQQSQEALATAMRKYYTEKSLSWGEEKTNGLTEEEDDEDKITPAPQSVVPGIQDAHGRVTPWVHMRRFRGVMPNEGPRKENWVCTIQGRVLRTIKLTGTILGKEAYMITVQVGQARKINLDIWCLHKHMMDGKATILPGEAMTITAGSVPQPGDLLLADVWIHGIIATGLDPVATAGELIGTPLEDIEDDQDVEKEQESVKGLDQDTSAPASQSAPVAPLAQLPGRGPSDVSIPMSQTETKETLQPQETATQTPAPITVDSEAEMSTVRFAVAPAETTSKPVNTSPAALKLAKTSASGSQAEAPELKSATALAVVQEESAKEKAPSEGVSETSLAIAQGKPPKGSATQSASLSEGSQGASHPGSLLPTGIGATVSQFWGRFLGRTATTPALSTVQVTHAESPAGPQLSHTSTPT